MIAPYSLSNVLTVLFAVTCLWTIGSQSSGGILKAWRLAVPPALALAVSLTLLAGVFEASLVHDGEWLAALLLGAAIGRTRGWLASVEADPRWGLVRLPRAADGLFAAFALLVLALTDSVGAYFETPIIEPQYIAAGAALCAGYLGFRALAMFSRAVRAPHVRLYDADQPG
jgi:hypothetical protein